MNAVLKDSATFQAPFIREFRKKSIIQLDNELE